LITIFNVVVFAVGGPPWDATPVATVHMFGHPVNLTVMGIGWSLMAAVIPFYLYRTLVQDKQLGGKLAYSTGLPELLEGQDDLGGRREVVHADGEPESA
jgi:uncharacterized membrane protein YdjX (TVP38/TMEM64 family)